ncbi:MAG: sulfatase-like hydrolase/transferase [Eubacterium sp.]|nr:sulfatase-like hydrolase/transferase [Candidatus Colimonas fimequi]
MGIIKKSWQKFKKFQGRYIVMLIVVAIILDIIIEALARHSVIASMVFVFGHPLVAICNISLIFAVLSLAMFFKKRCFATAILSLVWLALGITNGVILVNRMTPFTTKDLDNLKDGLSIVGNYFSIKTLIIVIVSVIAAIVLGIIIYRKSPRMSQKPDYKKVITTVVIAIGMAFGCVNVGMNTGILDTFFYNLAYAYADNGVPYCFVITATKSGVDKPADYSEEMIQNILSTDELGKDKIYTPGKDDNLDVAHKPNVIFLQLESFIDPTSVNSVKFNKDPIPNYRKLMKEYPSGYLTVPACGAGTANVEFEVMTGMSVKNFGPGEYPYKTVLKDNTVECAPYDMKQLGYSTHAIHNHRGAFYFRNKVFANMGFNTFTCLEYMNNVVKTPKNWAKDEILIGQITDALKSTTRPDYIYTISVQGHGRYPTEKVLEDPEIVVTDYQDEEQRWAYEYYANQVYEMDTFVKDLTGELSKFDEDVVLVMYGDHLPALDMKEYEMKNNSLYDTQYIVWSNFGLEGEDEDLMAYQLNAEVMKRLGISVGVMPKFHQNHHHSDTYLDDMKALTYDMLYGKQYIYGQTNPYKPTNLKMGVKRIKIKKIVRVGDKCFIKGENFTEFSKISLNGEPLKTVYLGPTLLQLNEDVDPAEAPRMKVSQVEKNKEILSTTE